MISREVGEKGTNSEPSHDGSGALFTGDAQLTTTGTSEERFSALADEFVERHRLGQNPSIEAYVAANLDLAAEIRRGFPALLMMEEFKPGSGDITGDFDAAAVVVRGARLERLGDFRVLREAGRGGMGVVYEAEQESLGRRVALKVLAAHAVPDPVQVRRFEREARAAAQLHHTNIVPVFGVGEQDGLHYYAMQFIPGLGLDSVIEEVKRLRSANSTSDPAQPRRRSPPRTGRGHRPDRRRDRAVARYRTVYFDPTGRE